MSRLAILTAEFLPFHGGVGTYARELAQAARGLGHEVTVFAPDYGEALANSDRKRFAYRVERFRASLRGPRWYPSYAITALKGQSDCPLEAGDVLVLMARGPMGSGMEETYQITSALKHLAWGKHVAVVTDARFSGVSTGACIGHVGPEALAGGPIGKLRDGDRLRIIVDRQALTGSVDYIGRDADKELSPDAGAKELASRTTPDHLAADPRLPEDTRLWAALQAASGGIWSGCVYDPDAIISKLNG